MKALYKSLSLNVVVVGVKAVHILLLNKAVAKFYGPAALVELGVFRDFLALAMAISYFSLGQAIVTEVSKQTDKKGLFAVIGNLCGLVLSISIVCFTVGVVSKWFGVGFLGKIDPTGGLGLGLIVAIPIIGLGEMSFFALVGLEKRDNANLVILLGTLSVAIASLGSLHYSNLMSATVTLLAGQVAIDIVLFTLLLRGLKFPNLANLLRQFDLSFQYDLFKYSLIAMIGVVSAIVPVLFVRDLIMNNYDSTTAGHWEAVWRLSSLGIVLVSTSSTLFILPKLAKIEASSELYTTIWKMTALTAAVALVLFTPLYMLRGPVLRLAYDTQYEAASTAYTWQLLGDFFRVIGFIPAFAFLVGKSIVKYGLGHLAYSCIFVGLVALDSMYFQAAPGSIAYCIACAVALLVLCLLLLYTQHQQSVASV